MKKYSKRKLALGFLDLLERYSLAVAVRALAHEIITQKMTRETDFVVKEIERELMNRGSLSLHVVSRWKLAAKLQAMTEGFLKDRYDAKQITAIYATDPAAAGGLVATTPTSELDLSIAGKLEQLKRSF